ncbi:MAG: hypothetical protein K0Q91_1064 [Fibrobacteria bacterium]|jgi:hypothetical protein|nr:hypothetical protein [Fibrobacteria bacterium]
MNIRRLLLTSLFALPLTAGFLYAQPSLSAQVGPEIPCSVDTSASAQIDTVAGAPDANGFYTIFDGKTSKGWWQNCLSTHSSGNRTAGGIFRVDSVRGAIYAMSRAQVGGLLSTKKRYAHYEVMFEWWPQFGNDGGLFNRYSILGTGNNTSVASNQMVLDYCSSGCGVFSYYSEAGYPGGRNGRPWSYNSVSSITIPGSGGGAGTQGSPDINDWSKNTSRQNLITGLGPADIGCASTGCVQADYLRLWNQSGWNQVRQVYYGGLSANQPATVTEQGDKIRMFTFFRKHYPLTDTNLTRKQLVNDTAKWVTVIQDSMRLSASQVATYQRVNPFAFQIHNGTRYVLATAGGRGSWYGDIKVRELDSLGVPTYIATSVRGNRKMDHGFRIVNGMLNGSLDLDHVVTITDLKGRQVLRYSGFAGRNLSRELPRNQGMLIVRVKTTLGTQTLRYNSVAK